ncbi:MAG: 4Fe-4S binding protein [Dehalococcoidia bacterium]|nr:4Fe-4S binding protein [Dehalococcoidia bacterium]
MVRLTLTLSKVKRWCVQLAFLVIFNSYFFQGLKRLPCLTLNCHACPLANFACPIGSIQHFGTIRRFPFYTLGIVGIVGLLIGRLACGWFCPFGFLQDLLYKIKVKKITTSNRYASWIKYGVFAVLVVIAPILTSETLFCKLCPAGALEAGIPVVLLNPEIRWLIGWHFWAKIAILVAFLIAMAHIKRPFCRFVCPMGTLYSLFNRVSVVKLTVDKDKCIECGKCKQVCPMDIAVYLDANSPHCIRCMECIKVCPVDAIS